MPHQSRVVAPGTDSQTVRTADGQLLKPPVDWALLPPGDAGLTRRVKAAGPTWTVQQKKGRKTFSLGVWAPRQRIEAARAALEAERATETYAKRQAASSQRRERVQGEYVQSFQQAVLDFLAFAPCYAEIANQLAAAVAEHATPVGSGTVARTKRIPVEQRAEAAVIAWLRHQTTMYDEMKIPRVKGKRREVRRMLAEQSRRLLLVYRTGQPQDRAHCPLAKALSPLAE
jgi:hypothetical protein